MANVTQKVEVTLKVTMSRLDVRIEMMRKLIHETTLDLSHIPSHQQVDVNHALNHMTKGLIDLERARNKHIE